MNPEMLQAIVFSILIGFSVGIILGSAMSAWGWRMSGESHHHSHKSCGKWYTVHPEGEGPLCRDCYYRREAQSWEDDR